jgi:hypothetical protein
MELISNNSNIIQIFEESTIKICCDIDFNVELKVGQICKTKPNNKGLFDEWKILEINGIQITCEHLN